MCELPGQQEQVEAMTDSHPSNEKVYPCGCSASPADEVPNYCPTHGRPAAEALFWIWFNALTPSARRFDLKLDAFCEGWAARGKQVAPLEPDGFTDALSQALYGNDPGAVRCAMKHADDIVGDTTDAHALRRLAEEVRRLRAAQPPEALLAEAKWLRIASDAMAERGHTAWSNTCKQAAQAIERSANPPPAAQARLPQEAHDIIFGYDKLSWSQVQRLREVLRATATKNVFRVGCEGTDGLLRVHGENETCDVCRPVEPAAALRALRLLASVPAVRQVMNPSGQPHQGNCGCPRCVVQAAIHGAAEPPRASPLGKAASVPVATRTGIDKSRPNPSAEVGKDSAAGETVGCPTCRSPDRSRFPTGDFGEPRTDTCTDPWHAGEFYVMTPSEEAAMFKAVTKTPVEAMTVPCMWRGGCDDKRNCQEAGCCLGSRAERGDPVETKVGCEGADGLLRIHGEGETCDVCAPRVAEVLRGPGETSAVTPPSTREQDQ